MPTPRALAALTLCCLTAALAPALTSQQPVEPKAGAAKATPDAWPHFRGGPAMTGVAPGTLADRFTLAWTFKTGDAILSSPVVVDDVVFVGSSDQHVYAVHAKTGEKKWAFKTDDVVDAPPLVLDGRVYIGSADFFFYCLDANTGKELWKLETGDKILGGANYAYTKKGELRIVVGSYDSRLYGFDENGKKLWEYETGNYINGTPGILDGNAVFGGCDAILHVVSVETGKKTKEVPLGDECHVAGSAGMADNKVYVGHYGNAFVCIDLDKLERAKWIYSSPRHAFFSAPSITKDSVIFGGRDRKLHCVSRDEGKPRWTFKTKRKVDGSPLVCGDKVVFGSGDGRLYMLDVKSGKELWKYEIGQSIFSSPAIAKGMIFIGASDGGLYAFRPKKDGKTGK